MRRTPENKGADKFFAFSTLSYVGKLTKYENRPIFGLYPTDFSISFIGKWTKRENEERQLSQ